MHQLVSMSVWHTCEHQLLLMPQSPLLTGGVSVQASVSIRKTDKSEMGSKVRNLLDTMPTEMAKMLRRAEAEGEQEDSATNVCPPAAFVLLPFELGKPSFFARTCVAGVSDNKDEPPSLLSAFYPIRTA